MCLVGPERAHFTPKLRGFERLFDEQHDLVDVERLVRIVIRALPHRLDRRIDVRKGGQHDYQRVGIVFFDLFEDCQTVRVRQPVIEQDQVHALAHALEGIGRVFRFEHLVAFISEPAGQRPPYQLFVVDDENCRAWQAVSV